MRSSTSTILLALAAPVMAGPGQVISFTGYNQLAGMKTLAFDATNTEFQKLSAGFTLMVWARFHDEASSGFNPTVQLNYASDGNFMQPFGGLHGGYEFTSNAIKMSSTTADKGKLWHHYAVSWKAADGETKHYLDGVLVNTATGKKTGTDIIADNAYSVVGMNCYPDTYLSPTKYTQCNTGHKFNGEMDDLAIFGGVLSDADVTSMFNADMTTAAPSEANLVIFYNFDTSTTGAGGQPDEVPNLGTAGAAYNLLLGAVSKASVFGTKITTGDGAPVDIVAPVLVPGTDGSSGTGDYGAAKTMTPSAASPTAATTVPVMPDPTLLAPVGLEDAPKPIQVWCVSPTGTATVKITTLPTKGTLYDIGADGTSAVRTTAVTAAGQALTDTRAPYVLYVPNANEFGSPLDSFAYTCESALSAASTPSAVSITIEGDNDKPVVTSSLTYITEDHNYGGILVDLNATDAETGTPLELMIHSLPAKGKLYQTSDGTLAGTRTEITAPYNIFEVGNTIEQYLDAVQAVSSYWGGPPYAGYHPLNALGPRDCKTYGECPQDGAWVTDNSVYPPIGQRLLDRSLTGEIVAHDKANGKVTIAYHKMYTGTAPPVQCYIDPAGASKSYPADCVASAAAFVGSSVNAATGKLEAVVDRTQVGPIDAAVWSPLNKVYVGTGAMTDQTSAFGIEYNYNHKQSDYYASGLIPPYTEYLDASIATPVYPILVEVGSSRGMGQIVTVKVKDTGGNWVRLYAGAALKDVQAFNAKTKTYFQWSPNSCRAHFKTQHLRIEVDTSAETGIADWNYVDYVKVYGSTDLQNAALPKGSTSVVYVPNHNANGADKFEYKASDCPGNLFRFSELGTVAYDITAVNDAPHTVPTYTTVYAGERSSVPVSYGDVDGAMNTLAFSFTANSGVEIADPASAALTPITSYPFAVPCNPSCGVVANISVVAGAVGNITIDYEVIDALGLKATGEVILNVIERPSDNTGLFIGIIAGLGGVVLIIAAIGIYKSIKFIRKAIEGRKKHEAAQRLRVQKAVELAVTMNSSAYLVTFNTFKNMGGLKTHEHARDNHWLFTVDNYDELVDVVNKKPVLFFSHQWLSWDHPDPDNIQYDEMVASCQEICQAKGFDIDEIYIFLDYLSIPQKNVNLRLAAINTLGVFSSVSPYFVVVAPTTTHKDTKKLVDKASYQRRGWCRLEQWGHMCLQGMKNMYFYDGKAKKLIAVEDGGSDSWFLDSIMVFGGEYTNPENKHEMVDVVLGLFAMVLRGRTSTTKNLYELIIKHKADVFPFEYFEELPELLESMLDKDAKIQTLMTSSGRLNLEYATMPAKAGGKTLTA